MFHFIGIDVSKATLQIYIPLKEENISIDNTNKSIGSLYSKLKKYYKKDYKDLVFIFEATGPYSLRLEHFCAEHNILIRLINPRQSANFAKALDNRSKSDIIDAKMLYQFHVLIRDEEIKVPIIDTLKERLGEMLSYYKLLKKQRNGFSNHLEALDAKEGSLYIRKQLSKEIKQLKVKEEDILKDMAQLIKSDEYLNERFKNLQTFKGIGSISAIALIHLFISYPQANRQEITALSGLDAIEISSGTSLQKPSRISKRGNTIYRSILFMPVLSTVIHNPYMKAFYDRLKANGKHSTLAQIAVMRKTMLIAHSLFKNNCKFDNDLYEKRVQWNPQDHDENT